MTAIAIYKIALRLVSKQLFTANMSDLHLSTDSFRQTLSDFQAAARTTVVQTDDSQVATVMGSAADAAIQPDEIRELIVNDLLLTNLVDGCDQADALKMRILEFTQQISTQTAEAVKDAAINAAQVQIAQPIAAAMSAGIQQANECNAAARALLTEAIGAAGDVGADQHHALVTFEADIEALKQGVAQLADYDATLLDTAKELQDVFSPGFAGNLKAKCEMVTKLRTLRMELENLKCKLQHDMCERFDEATLRNKDTDVRRQLVALDVPKDLAEGKGQLLIENVTAFLRGRATDYFAIIPYLRRIFNDFDAKEGCYFKPPSFEDEYSEVCDELRVLYKAQSALLFSEIQRKANTVLLDDIEADFAYGMHDQLGPIHCTEGDGVMAVFCLITKFRPQDAEFRDGIEQCFVEAHKHFTTGDPRKRISFLQSKLNDAIKLKIPMKWSSTGKSIAQVVARIDPDLAHTLRKYKTISPTPAQTPTQLNRMFAAIKLACNDIDKGNSGKSNKNWNYKAHSLDRRDSRVPIKDRLGHKNQDYKNSKEPRPCRDGDKCKRKDCWFGHKKSKSGLRPCMAVGCKEDVTYHGKKLCKKHFDKVRETGSLKLNDGSDFVWHSTEKPKDNKFKFDASAVAMAAAKVMMEDLSDDDDDDDDALRAQLPRGPLSAKRSALQGSAHSAKKAKRDSVARRVERVMELCHAGDGH